MILRIINLGHRYLQHIEKSKLFSFEIAYLKCDYFQLARVQVSYFHRLGTNPVFAALHGFVASPRLQSSMS